MQMIRKANQAIQLYHANTTSCLRPKLIQCINGSDSECVFAMYDNLNSNMVHNVGVFSISNVSEGEPIIVANNSNIALDNINITSKKQNMDTIVSGTGAICSHPTQNYHHRRIFYTVRNHVISFNFTG